MRIIKKRLGFKIPSKTKIIIAALALIIVFGKKYKFFVPVRASYIDTALLSHTKRGVSVTSPILKALNASSPDMFPVVKPQPKYVKTWLYLCGHFDANISAVVNHFYGNPSCFFQLCRLFGERIDRKLLKGKFIEDIPEKELTFLRKYAKMKEWKKLLKVPLRKTLDKDLFKLYNTWSKHAHDVHGIACSPNINTLLSTDKRCPLDILDNPKTIEYLEKNIYFKDEPSGMRAWFRPIQGLKEQRAFLPARRWIISPFEQAIVLPLEVAYFALESVLPFDKYQSLPLVSTLISSSDVRPYVIPHQHKSSRKKSNVRSNKRKYLLMRELFA